MEVEAKDCFQETQTWEYTGDEDGTFHVVKSLRKYDDGRTVEEDGIIRDEQN